MLVDFTRNKQEVAQAVAGLYFPNFHEANLFDALLETLDELRDVKGKEVDTFAGERLRYFQQAHTGSNA